MDTIIGGFYQTPRGIVRTYAWTGGEILYYFDDDLRYSASPEEAKAWIHLPELRDFPNARDPLLPYDFDLCWDIKYLSDLKRELVGHWDESSIRALMTTYKISI